MMLARVRFKNSTRSAFSKSIFNAITPSRKSLPGTSSSSQLLRNYTSSYKRVYQTENPFSEFERISFFGGKYPILLHLQNISLRRVQVRDASNASLELSTDADVVRFSIGASEVGRSESQRKANKAARKVKKMSRKAKLNELKFYRLMAKKKMKSPNPEVRIRYKLEKAKRKEAWLIEKLTRFKLPRAPLETYDPEILTEEERFFLKRTGEKKKHYVPVGRRGVFGGVVLNMHLHWKKHETVKVICRPCKPGQVEEFAAELARLSRGIVIDIKPNNTILFYRGKNYVQPDVMLPPDTLSKAKALEKYRFEQSLEHTSQFIEKLEKELEEYHEHLSRYRKEKETMPFEFSY